MKKTIFMLLMLVASLPALAQTGLHVDELFQGRVIPQEQIDASREVCESLGAKLRIRTFDD